MSTTIKKTPWGSETTEVTLFDMYVMQMLASGMQGKISHFMKTADSILTFRDKLIRLNKKKDIKNMI